MPAAEAPAAPTAQLDTLGHPPELTDTLRLRCIGVPDSSRNRLSEIGAQLSDDPEPAVDALIVSTRLPPDELEDVADQLGARVGRTIVLAHTGAERLAADLVRAGADAVVGEGNEQALIGLVDPDRTPTALLNSFERRFGNLAGPGHRGLDPATGLADLRSFEQRIGALADADEIPRVALLKVISERWSTRDPDTVVAVQQRRLAILLEHASSPVDAELYATAPAEFGLVSASLSPNEAERLGNRLIATAATFRDRGLPLRMVMGHAGPESASDVEELLDLARRAVEVAAVDGTRQVLGAEDLALGVSVTTELEAVVRLLDEVEPALPEGRGHGERVGRIAAELARMRGCSPAAVSRIHLAAHLHDVGRSGLPAQVVSGPEGLSGELLDAWRTFPIRSAELLQLTAGPAVAEAVRSQCERWDGNGFPDGIRGSQIDEGARTLAVAHRIDELMAAERGTTTRALAAALEDEGGASFDPDVVASAIEHLPGLLAARGGAVG